jgi:predicted  nucleic acid-binding Zn-ribbon protein
MVKKGDTMPTKKTTTTQDTSALKRRISELSDRITMLESNLTKTQERVQSDMKMLFERLNRSK